MAITKIGRGRETRQAVAPIYFLAEVDREMVRQFMRTLASTRTQKRIPKREEGYFELQAKQPSTWLRWCWGHQFSGATQVIPDWTCILCVSEPVADGRRHGVFMTPKWHTQDGRMTFGEEWSACKDALFERLRAGDPRFELADENGRPL